MTVRWTIPALRELREARRYVEADNPRAASALGERIEESVQRLSLFPEMGRIGRRAGTRELVIPGTTFVIAYRIAAGAVEVLAVIHGARKWPEAL